MRMAFSQDMPALGKCVIATCRVVLYHCMTRSLNMVHTGRTFLVWPCACNRLPQTTSRLPSRASVVVHRPFECVGCYSASLGRGAIAGPQTVCLVVALHARSNPTNLPCHHLLDVSGAVLAPAEVTSAASAASSSICSAFPVPGKPLPPGCPARRRHTTPNRGSDNQWRDQPARGR